MSKSHRRPIPTRFLPRGARRITNTENERVWLINGREFPSKRAYFQYLDDLKLSKQIAAQPAEPEIGAVKSPADSLDISDPVGI